MRKALRGLVGRDRRPAVETAHEPPVNRIQPVVQHATVAETGVEVPVAQPAEPPTATPLPTTLTENDNETSVLEDLWTRAYRALSEREPELVEDYAKHVEAGSVDAAGALSNPDSVRALVKSLQDTREKSQWKFSIRSKDHKVSDQLEKFVKLLALADGVVKQAVSSQPYAALAWSTVSVFIPVCICLYSFRLFLRCLANTKLAFKRWFCPKHGHGQGVHNSRRTPRILETI